MISSHLGTCLIFLTFISFGKFLLFVRALKGDKHD